MKKQTTQTKTAGKTAELEAWKQERAMRELNGEVLPSNFSTFDGYVIKAVGCLVPDQKASMVDANGRKYLGTCKQVGNLGITTITRDGQSWVKIVYDYDTDKEVYLYGN